MSAVVSRTLDIKNLPVDRRERILDAAEACFVRNGFDRTTMNDLAREAAMSPANLYRYFDSKELLVIGLVEREAERGAALVAQFQRAGDARAELLTIIDQHYLRISRETAILRLDICSEATRNPAIAELVDRYDRQGRSWLAGILAKLASSPDCNLVHLQATLETMLRGIIVSRALVPDYDLVSAGRHLLAVLDAGLAPPPASPHEARE